MKKHIIAAAIVIAAIVWSASIVAQPAGGFSKTAPLTGTGSNGSPLRLTPCSDGQVYQYGSGGWWCTTISGGSGDITGVTAGSGLLGGGPSGAVTLYVQGVSGGGIEVTSDTIGLLSSCSLSEILKWDGLAWECAPDDGGSYTEGDNIDITGSVVSLMPYVSLDGSASETTLELNGVVDQSVMTVADSSAHTDSINYVSINPTGSIDGETAPYITSGVTIDNDTTSSCSGECSFPPTHRALWTKTGEVLFEGATEVDDNLTVTGTLDTNAADIGAGGLNVSGGVSFSGASTQIDSGATTIGTTSGDTLNVYATTTLHSLGQVVGSTQVETTWSGAITLASTTRTLILNNGSPLNLDGLTGGTHGREILVIFANAAVTLRHQNAGAATATDRFVLGNAASWIKRTGNTMRLMYETTVSSRWSGEDGIDMAALTVAGASTFTGSITTQSTATMGNDGADVFNVRGIAKDTSTAPTVSACGTSPGTPTGGSNWWKVVVGTGGSVTSCTFTYENDKGTTSICEAEVNNATEDVYISAESDTAVTVTAKSGTTDLSGDTISVRCLGDG